MELNGFEIEKYNIYGLQEGSKLSTCPKCSADRKPANQKVKCMMLDWTTGIGTCQHCNEVIQLHTYKKKNDIKTYFRPEFKNNTNLSDKLVAWFQKRGISQFTLRHMKIGEGLEWMPQTKKEENTLQFNYFRDGELINTKFRDGRKNFKMVKDAEKIFYNMDNFRTSNEVIICEGEMDTLSYIECGYWIATSTPNGSTIGNVNLDFLDSCYDWFENKEKIYLALDADQAGQNVQAELIRRLGAERCFLVDFEGLKDANEYLIAHGKEALQNTIKNAKQCPLENIQILDDVKPELHDFYLNGMPKGNVIGINKFDDKFSSNTSQYIVVTGIPGMGKSDWVDQMCVGYNLNYNWKIGYCSPENKPTVLHIDKIARKFHGERPKTKTDLDSIKWKTVEERINSDFFFIEMEKYNLRSVLNKGAELVKRKGIKCLVIDPFNKVPLIESRQKNVNEYTSDYLSEIDDFCRKYNVLVILVAHPVKQHKENGLYPIPTFYDIKGGGEFFDMAYHGLCVHRNMINNTVLIKVLKCKFQHLGENNAEINFVWSKLNGRYCDFFGDPLGEECQINPIWNNENILCTDNSIQQSMFNSNEPHYPNSRIEPPENFWDEPEEKDVPF